MQTWPASLALILFAFALASAAPAQSVGGQWETLHQFDGAALDRLGSSVAGAGDVDGDGTPDLIVGAPDASPNGLANAGSARVYSAATGDLIWTFDGVVAGDRLGVSVSGAGDVDGDGFDDVIMGARRASPRGLSLAGSAFVHSGATGALLWRFDGAAAFDLLGGSVAGAGDVDGDGFDDVIVGASFADPGGRRDAGSAFVHSGASGAVIWRFDGAAASDTLGLSVSGAGDVNGDGFQDLVVGALPMFSGGFLLSGSAFVYDGATGALLFRFDGKDDYEALGASVSGAGDVDRDGFDDVLAGAPGAGPGGLVGAGAAHVFSGATGLQLWQFRDSVAGDDLGVSVAGTGDVDGDGAPDLLVGASGADPGGRDRAGSAHLYSGATGALIRKLEGAAAGDHLGLSVAGAGDLDGDGLREVLAGAPFAQPNGLAEAGSALVFSLDPFLHPDARELSASGGVPVQLDLAFPASEAGFGYAVLASAAGTGPTTIGGIEVPLTSGAILNRMLTGWSPPVLSGAFGTLDGAGMARARVDSSPVLAAFVGRTFHLAAVSYDAATLAGRLSSVARPLTVVR